MAKANAGGKEVAKELIERPPSVNEKTNWRKQIDNDEFRTLLFGYIVVADHREIQKLFRL